MCDKYPTSARVVFYSIIFICIIYMYINFLISTAYAEISILDMTMYILFCKTMNYSMYAPIGIYTYRDLFSLPSHMQTAETNSIISVMEHVLHTKIGNGQFNLDSVAITKTPNAAFRSPSLKMLQQFEGERIRRSQFKVKL